MDMMRIECGTVYSCLVRLLREQANELLATIRRNSSTYLKLSHARIEAIAENTQ